MSRHWAVVIGVNQYQFRQPLLCAQDDAQAMYEFLTDEAGVSKQSCVLLSDRAPKVADTSTYPTAATLKNWLGGLTQAGVQPADRLWIFFSGYGECWNEQDYLLPIDAEASCSPKTWLSIRSLYSMLSKLPSKNILLMLDISRSQSSRSGNLLGRHTMQNAKEFGISTILSCQPEQFSHESTELGNGFFTAALLEGLQSQASQPLIKLVRFLQARLPELSQHHQRPRQDPIVMVAPTHLEQWHLPAVTPKPHGANAMAVPPQTASARPSTSPVNTLPKTVRPTPQTILQPPQTILQKPAQPASTAPITDEDFNQTDAQPPMTSSTSGVKQGDWKQDIDQDLTSGLSIQPPHEPIASIPATNGATVLSNTDGIAEADISQAKPLSRRDRHRRKSTANAPTADDRATAQSAIANGAAISLDQVSQPVNPQPPRRRPRSTPDEDIDMRKVLVQILALGALLTVVLGLAKMLWRGEGQPSLLNVGKSENTLSAPSSSNPPSNAAGSAAEPSPTPMPTAPSPDPSARLNVPQSPPADSAKILADARAMIRPTNASEVQRAIERASQIPPGDGRYEETQRQIDRWCADMLLIARGRANRGNFRDAIAAARLVPGNRGELSKQAKKLINQWQKRIR